MRNVIYEQPREKLARKGASSLSNAELLQVIIGSGNAQASVSKIAKKVAKVLARSGPTVHPQELLVINGVGKVKAGQILALFELASRFPLIPTGNVYDTNQSLQTLYADIKTNVRQTILYASFDGAMRLIQNRQFVVNNSAPISRQVQKIFADCLTDSAASVVVAMGYNKQQLQPTIAELNFVRDVYQTAKLLSIQVRQLTLVSKQGHNVLKEDII